MLASFWVLATKYKSAADITEPSAQLDSDKPVITGEVLANAEALVNESKLERPVTEPETNIHPPDLRNEEWILKINPSSFVIQFGSSADVDLFDEFIPIINSGEPIAIYPFKFTPSGLSLIHISEPTRPY